MYKSNICIITSVVQLFHRQLECSLSDAYQIETSLKKKALPDVIARRANCPRDSAYFYPLPLRVVNVNKSLTYLQIYPLCINGGDT